MTSIIVTCEVGEAHAPFLTKHLRSACRLVEGAPKVVLVAVVDEDRMSQLHQRFLGKPDPTDVLSFPLETDAAGRVVEGEVVVCLDVAQAESGKRAHPVERELLLYALHGLLHLSGYDDLNEVDSQRMHAREDEILSALGLGPVFAPAAPGAG